jgi:hypothetical protein
MEANEEALGATQTVWIAAMADIIHWFMIDEEAEAVQADADEAEIWEGLREVEVVGEGWSYWVVAGGEVNAGADELSAKKSAWS